MRLRQTEALRQASEFVIQRVGLADYFRHETPSVWIEGDRFCRGSCRVQESAAGRVTISGLVVTTREVNEVLGSPVC